MAILINEHYHYEFFNIGISEKIWKNPIIIETTSWVSHFIFPLDTYPHKNTKIN